MLKKHSVCQKGFVPILIILVIVVLVAGGGYAVSRKVAQKRVAEKTAMMEKDAMQKDKDAMMKKSPQKEEAMMEKPVASGEEIMEKKDAMMKPEASSAMVSYAGTVLAGTSSKLLDFKKADYDAVLKTDKLVVLYFYANWCPICRLEFPKTQDAFNELATDQVIGFRVNYNDSDTDADEKALTKEHGVAYQHTKVFLKNGKQILKAPDSWNKMRYLDEVQKAIAQ